MNCYRQATFEPDGRAEKISWIDRLPYFQLKICNKKYFKS